MKNKALFWLVFAVSLAVSLVPALTYFGVKDILPVSGYQLVEPPQKLTWRNFKTHKFQANLERRFAKRFFLRGFMYRLRCQTMELANLGVFHEGNNQKIGQFKDGTLFQYVYFNDYYNPNCKLSQGNVSKTLKAIGDLGKVLASNGVDMVFVMATDKIEFMRKPMPGLISALFKKRRDEFQTEFGDLLSANGIPYFDTFSFLTNVAPNHAEQMFPYAGTHWNALASSLVVDELLTRLNSHATKTYTINRLSGVEETSSKSARFKDDDIGLLLNLLYNPYLKKNRRFLPKFEDEDFTPNEGGVIVFGDSFSVELAQSMKMSKDFDPVKTLVLDKRLPSTSELNWVSSNLRLVVFVYVSPHLLRMDRLPQIGGHASTFCRLLVC